MEWKKIKRKRLQYDGVKGRLNFYPSGAKLSYTDMNGKFFTDDQHSENVDKYYILINKAKDICKDLGVELIRF